MRRYPTSPTSSLRGEHSAIRRCVPVAPARSICLVALILVVSGCYPKVGAAPGALSTASATSASARWPGVTAATLATGRDLFLARCNGCHGYPDPAAIPDERWPAIVEKMGGKSGLGADERGEVLHYILAARSEPAR
jgi:mono/diheme cytochrome c family protein